MATGLELFDTEGNVTGSIEDVDEGDELESVFNPKEEAGEGEEEGSEGETPPAEEPAAEEGEEDSPDEEKEGEPDKPVEGEGEEKEEEEEEPPVPAAIDPEEENRNLRVLARDQKKELAFLKARLERLEKAVVMEPEEGEEGPTPARIEELQAVINEVAQAKGPVFEVLLETMEQNPKYADIREVCSQGNFNYIISTAADKLAADEGKDSVEVALELEAAIWTDKNPYKVMYNLIKEHHPKYIKPASKKESAESAASTEKKEEKPVEKKAVGKPPNAPSSIADAGTGSKTGIAGWTAARIDQMDEMELSKVPPEVYEKYMQGQLD